MAYNQPYYGGFYPPTYYPNGNMMPDMMNQQKVTYQQVPPATSNDFIWVLSEVEAQSYPVAPNNTVTLWDKNTPTIYIKSANPQGVPTLRTLDFTERTADALPKSAPIHECQCGNKYASKTDFETLKNEFETLRNRLEQEDNNG